MLPQTTILLWSTSCLVSSFSRQFEVPDGYFPKIDFSSLNYYFVIIHTFGALLNSFSIHTLSSTLISFSCLNLEVPLVDYSNLDLMQHLDKVKILTTESEPTRSIKYPRIP